MLIVNLYAEPGPANEYLDLLEHFILNLDEEGARGNFSHGKLLAHLLFHVYRDHCLLSRSSGRH